MNRLVLEEEQPSVKASRPRKRPAEVELDPEALKTFCSVQHRLNEDELDVLWLAGWIAYSDRNTIRHRARGWSRSLKVTIPVSRPDLWNAPRVQFLLTDCLSYLSGDRWTIIFTDRPQPLNTAVQLRLLEPDILFKVVQPFSGGMDSLATAILLASTNRTPLPVTTNVNATVAALADATLKESSLKAVKVPVRHHLPKHTEPTYRTRTFLYYCVASVAARLAALDNVIVAEPGQGAIGAAMVPFYGEHPVRGSHPGFTMRLEHLLNEVWGTSPRFELVNLWRTKAELVADIVKIGRQSELVKTRSCSRRMNQGRGLPQAPRSCGICGGCLFRRMSMIAAGINDEPDQYIWSDLHCTDLDRAAGGILNPDPVDREVAAHAIVTLRDFARLAGGRLSYARERTTQEVSKATKVSVAETRDQVERLVATHAREWERFLTYAGPNSWVTQLAGR